MVSLPQPTKADSHVLAEAMKSENSSFKLLYFPLHGRAELIRFILAHSGAKYEEIEPVSP